MPIIIRHRLYIHVVKTLNFKNRGPQAKPSARWGSRVNYKKETLKS